MITKERVSEIYSGTLYLYLRLNGSVLTFIPNASCIEYSRNPIFEFQGVKTYVEHGEAVADVAHDGNVGAHLLERYTYIFGRGGSSNRRE